MDNLNTESVFVVVEFDEKSNDDTPVVDLVPRSWIKEVDDNIFCRYPNKSSYNKINKWVQEQKKPDASWDEYPVKIMNEAKGHAQGLRRLRRTIKNLDPAPSTDGGDTDTGIVNESMPAKLPPKKITSLLEENPALPGDTSQLNLTTICGEILTNFNIEDINKNSNGNQLSWTTMETFSDMLKTHIDQKLKEMEENLIRKINSSKTSILYDLERKMVEVKNNITMSANCTKETATEARETLHVPLPISELENFLAFDAELLADKPKANALKTMFSFSIIGLKTVKDDIACMMPMVMTKPVQLKYSACGRKIKNTEPKLNFSATATFNCMKELLEEKYVNHPEPLGIISKLGRWLAGANDREGGRRERSSNPE